MKHYRGIEAKYLAPTNTKDSRIKLTDRHNKRSVYLNALDTINTVLDTSEKWLTEKGFNIVGFADMGSYDVILVDNWGDNFIELKK